MLKLSSVSGTACAVGLMAGAASAMPLASDDFSYADGLITTVSGGTWTAQSTGTGINSVVDEAYFIDDDKSGDVHIKFSQVNSGLLYAGFDLTVDSVDQPSSNLSDQPFFAHFAQNNGSTNIHGGVFLLPGSQAGKFKLGLNGFPTVASNVLAFSGEFDTGTTYRLILEVDHDANTTRLFVDATSTSDPSLSESFGGISFSDAFTFRGWDADDGDKTVDNLLIATTFAEVVPEPASLAMLGLGGLALLGRRRR